MIGVDDNFLYKKAQSHLAESARVKRLVAGMASHFSGAGQAIVAAADMSVPAEKLDLIAPIVSAAKLIAGTFQSGGKLLLCGNGGSAADCQHMAAEFVSRLTKDFSRPGLPAIALTTDTSFITAFANDESFDGVFARQIQALGKPGDVLLAISTSGESSNILRAAETAKSSGMGMQVVALCGQGERLKGIADIAIAVPSPSVHHIQEAHLAIEHVICDLVEHILFNKGAPTVSEASDSAV